MRGRWAFYAGATVAVAATTFAAPAAADHHLIKLSEVFAGSDASPNAEYVEMQMTASGRTDSAAATPR